MYVVFDIGGTKMRVAGSRDGTTLAASVSVPTPEHYAEGLHELLRLIDQARGDKVLRGIAGGIAGPFGRDHASLRGSPNLGDWIGKPLRDDLQKQFEVPVYLENDAALAGLGEAVKGAGKRYDIVAYLTISTGVGGVRIVRGAIDAHGMDFEPGHQIFDNDGRDLGACISGKAITTRMGQRPEDIHDETFWEEFMDILAIGLHNVSVFWTPEVIVLGGSIMTDGRFVRCEAIAARLSESLTVYPTIPEICIAKLGDESGLSGALYYLNEKMFREHE